MPIFFQKKREMKCQRQEYLHLIELLQKYKHRWALTADPLVQVEI